MKYATCPNCGRRLCKGESGTKVEIECPKCGTAVEVVIDNNHLHISDKTQLDKPMKQTV